MKNSKYDDNFLVDYSGNQNKIRKIDESGKSSGIGKLLETEQTGKRSSKRSAKYLKKQDDKENLLQVQPFEKTQKFNEENIFNQILKVKIGKSDLQFTKHKQQEQTPV